MSKLELSSILEGSSILFNKKIATIKALNPDGELRLTVDTDLFEASRLAYGTVDFAHIIGFYNGVTNEGCLAGKILYYPNIDRVNELLK